MANNNGLNVLDAITAAKLGKGTGGGSGSVTKEYVDTQVGAVSERVDDVESVIPSTAAPQNPLATASDVSNTAIPSTSTTSPVTNSADGMARGLTIYGRSHKSKNLLEITAETRTINGVTFTVNKAAGTITANGTATGGNATFVIWSGASSTCSFGNKILSGGINVNKYLCVELTNSPYTRFGRSIGNAATINSDISSYDNETIICFVRVLNGETANNDVFRPMICTAADYEADPTFEPYFEGIKSVGEGWSTVDLGTLTWNYDTSYQRFYTNSLLTTIKKPTDDDTIANIITPKYKTTSINYLIYTTPLPNKIIAVGTSGAVSIRDTDYTDPAAFKTAMSGVLLCYQLADPSQGNAIAVKTDNGTGIDGTMAVFETGTPLYGVSDTVRDVMMWDGSAGTVTKTCNKIRLEDLKWVAYTDYPNHYIANIDDAFFNRQPQIAICNAYTNSLLSWDKIPNKHFNLGQPVINSNKSAIAVYDTDYTTVSDFVASLGDAELVYELATPVTTPLTDTEISAFRQLRTFDSTTNINITDEPDFEIDYLKNTENGQAVADLQSGLQSQIDVINSRTAGMITVSPLLTLTAAGWDSTTKQQTVTFAHDTSRRNVIDITIGENAAWDAAGVYAVSETASGITFECSEIPETALTFRVTSMEVS